MEQANEGFLIIPGREYPFLSDKQVNEYFIKWSMKGRLNVATFTFDHMFVPYKSDSFFTGFFNSLSVQNALTIPYTKTIVKIKSVRCTLTNLDVFRKLSSVTHECGKIKTRLDDVFESILISDKLREIQIVTLFLPKKRGKSFFFACSNTFVLEVKYVSKKMRLSHTSIPYAKSIVI
ncbi:unnamed protein product [Schistosoma rodhaini]|uniref:Cilia- and flagella-associated protein 300 n=1 Tax=Schistosoma rodhaini TaxID=6188 RepID=A0AA85F6Z7_9TREM|nr:unnamed protein product [Schistosoma rodhaini]CAH8480758.1 unnamed protein product [Schistosoma rodhaini]